MRKRIEDQPLSLDTHRLTDPHTDGNLMHHHHQILTLHFPRINPVLQHVQRSLIAPHIGEVAVEMQWYR